MGRYGLECFKVGAAMLPVGCLLLSDVIKHIHLTLVAEIADGALGGRFQLVSHGVSVKRADPPLPERTQRTLIHLNWSGLSHFHCRFILKIEKKQTTLDGDLFCSQSFDKNYSVHRMRSAVVAAHAIIQTISGGDGISGFSFFQ